MKKYAVKIFALMGGMLLAAAAAEDRGVFNMAAARVNNQSLSIRDVEALYHDSYVVIQDRLRKGELAASNLEGAVRLAWKEALDTAIQDKILDQRAAKRKKEIVNFVLAQAGAGGMSSDKAYERFLRIEGDYLNKMRQQLIAAAGGEKELVKALERRGQTMAQWNANLENELFRRDVLSMELGGITVKPSEIKDYYDKHPEQFGQAEAWRLRRIRIAKNKLGTPENALAAARMVKQAVEKEGKDIAEIAAKLSDDPDYAERGGLMTRNGQTDLPPGAFPVEEKIASELKEGAISEPVNAGDWYVLVQRLGHQEARVLKYEEASERAEALAYTEKIKAKKKEMCERLKRESFVEILQNDPPESLLKGAK